MASLIKLDLNHVDPDMQSLVYGYIREIERTLDVQIVPESISILCLTFFYIADYFATANDAYHISEDGKTIEKLVHKYDTSAFGKLKIASEKGGVFCWKFKIEQEETSMYIGITTDHDRVSEDLWSNNNGFTVALSTTGSKVVNGFRNAGFWRRGAFKTGGVIEMILDLNKRELRYIANGDTENVGVLYKNLKVGTDVKYQMAVAFLNKQSKITLLEFVHYDESTQ